MSRLTAFSDSGRFSVIQAILSLTSYKTFWSSLPPAHSWVVISERNLLQFQSFLLSVLCLTKDTAHRLHGHSGIELLFASSLPTAFPLDTIGRHYKLPSRYPDNHDDMCQTERQILHWIQILVLVRIDGVLSTPAFSNCVQHIVLKPFQLRMPFDDVPPAFIG